MKITLPSKKSTISSKRAFIKLKSESKFKVGDRVKIPVRKTYGCLLQESSLIEVYKRATIKPKFCYITGVFKHECKSYSSSLSPSSLDYKFIYELGFKLDKTLSEFNKSDLELYDDSLECIKEEIGLLLEIDF